jgi:uncharacterized lipoprotein YddW (UPF0748 family)
MRKMILLILIITSVLFTACGKSQTVTEIRGVWLTNVDSEVLESRENIVEAMQFLAAHNFNVVFPVVYNDARTLYPSQVMDSLFSLPIHEHFAGRDPLQELTEAAHAQGIAVVPWFEYGFASSYKKNGGHILTKFPDWAARDSQGNLLTKNGFEWLNAYHPEVQQFLLALIEEVIRNYDIDGIQGDDRLPAQPSEGGYSAFTRALYAAEHNGSEPPADPADSSWVQWRAEKLDDFAGTVFKKARSLDPDLVVSWAPSVFPWSREQYLQDWPSWIKNQHAHLVIPQVYRYDIEAYRNTLRQIMPAENAGSTVIVPGVLMNVGKYVISEEYLLAAMAANRSAGFKGEVFFFYEGLRKNNNQLAAKIIESYYQAPADLPAIFRKVNR